MDYVKIRDCAAQMYNYAKDGDYRLVYPAKEYYNAGLESPSTAMLIMNDEVKKQTLSSLQDAVTEQNEGQKGAIKELLLKHIRAGKNMIKADSHDMVIDNKRAFCAKINELYPVSAPARVAIIDKQAVVFDYVVPKFTGIKKFFLARLAKKYMRQMR